MGPKIDFSKAILDAAASTCHVDSVMSAERMLVKSYVDTYIFYFLFFLPLNIICIPENDNEAT